MKKMITTKRTLKINKEMIRIVMTKKTILIKMMVKIVKIRIKENPVTIKKERIKKKTTMMNKKDQTIIKTIKDRGAAVTVELIIITHLITIPPHTTSLQFTSYLNKIKLESHNIWILNPNLSVPKSSIKEKVIIELPILPKLNTTPQIQLWFHIESPSM